MAEAVAALGALPVPGGSEPEPDALTRAFVPVQALREERGGGEHWATLHHSYTTPHDLPETGGDQ